MSGAFDADWLALRAEADARARDPDLLAAAAEAAKGGLVVDLGAGTGATLSALAVAAQSARWRLVDRDPALLGLAAAQADSLGATAEAVALNLAADLETALAEGPALIAASAFFDLVSAAWIDRFAAAARRRGAAVYAALSYDGRERWTPPHPEDPRVHAAFKADMARDKGFGPAIGPNGAARLAETLAAEGYEVRTAETPWRLTARRDGALIAALAEGKARAAGASAGWLAARRGAETAEIGHVDLFARL